MIPYKTYVQEDQLFLALYGSTTIQSLLFLKNIKNFVWFPKQYLLGFFLLEKQLANILDGVSCFSVTLFYFTLFCCGGKPNLVRFTLFYSTLLTLTDGMTDRGTNTLASRGLVEPFFQLCCCVSILFWREIGFGLHTTTLRVGWRNLPTLCVGWRNFFSSCAVVSVFSSSGK